MRTRTTRSLLAATLLLSIGLFSCDEQKERIFNNPFDATGTSWSPPRCSVLTRDVDVGMGDTTILKAVASDPDSQDRVAVMRASVFGLFEDSMAVPTDTVGGKVVSVDTIRSKAVFAEPGRTYRVAVMVHDSRGVWSVRPDTAVVRVHRYPPVAAMQAMTDSVEPGDTVKYAMAWSDTAGKVVRFVWRHNGKTDTTRDSIASFVAGGVGTDLVTGYVMDDDGNYSEQVEAITVVRTLNPVATLLKASSDTVEENKAVEFSLKGSDRSPGRIVKWFVSYESKVDSLKAPGAKASLVDTSIKVVLTKRGPCVVSAYAVDEDGYVSSMIMDTVFVTFYPPTTISVKAVKDTVEKGKAIRITVRGSDRKPGRIAKWCVYSETKDSCLKDSTIEISAPKSEMAWTIAGYVIDDDGYKSEWMLDTVVVTSYPPKADSLQSAKDTVELNKPATFRLKGSDRSPGRIVKWMVAHDNKTDSVFTTDATKSLTSTTIDIKPVLGGKCYVSAYAVDEDGNVSNLVSDTVVVTTYVPKADSLKSSSDTTEPGKAIRFRLYGSDRSPGKIAKYVFFHDGDYDTAKVGDTISLKPDQTGNYIVGGFVIDDDGYTSAMIRDTIKVVRFAPKVDLIKAASDTGEVGKSMSFTMRGSDRSPGKIAKWVFSYGGKNDTVKVDLSKDASTSASIAAMPMVGGAFVVGGYAVDDDGNMSNMVYDTVVATTYIPKADSLKSSSDTTEPGKPVRFRLYGSDRSPGKVAKYVFFHDGKYDTAKVGDTLSLKPDQTGSFVVGGYVVDDDGNASAMVRDTIKVVRYAPKADSISAASDTGEVGKPMLFTMRGSDRSPGKIAKWVFSYGGRNDTIKADLSMQATISASIMLTPTAGGTFVVGGHAVDDDGNASNTVYDTIIVTSYIPAITSLKAADTAEVGKALKIVLKAVDRSPGKIAKWVFTYGGSDPDTVNEIADSVIRTWTPKTKGAFAIAAFVIDNDGNVSPAKAIQVVVTRYAPTATIKGPDSVEINQDAKFTITGTDRAPGTIKRYAWSYAGTTDTTGDSTRTFKVPGSVGTMTVAGWTIDDDSNMSERAEVNVEIKSHAPVLQAFSATPVLYALGDTAMFVWKASDAPTDPDGKALDFVWSTSDGRFGRCHAGDTVRIRDSVAKQIQIDVKACDKDSLSSTTQTLYVHFIPKSATITSPGSHELLASDTVGLAWTAGLFDDSFIVLLDTLPIASSSQSVLIRDTVKSTSLSVRVPVWDKNWHVRILSREGGDSALSDERSFATPEDADKRTTLAGLVIAADYDLNTPYSLDSAFRADDTIYNVQLPEGVTSVYVQGTGTLPQEVIEIGGQQGAGTAKFQVGVVTVPMTIPVKVNAGAGKLFRTYRINVTRVTQSYVKLEGLSLGAGYSLSPAFHPDTTNYAVSIPAGETAPINSTVNNLATVVVKHNNGANYWDNEAVVRGSAEDTAGVLLTVSRTGASDNYYRIKVKILPSREPRLSQLLWADAEWLSIDSTSFLRNLGEGTVSTWVRPYLRSGQTMTVDGATATSETNQTFTLVPGMNTHTIKVTAPDGVTTRTYTLLFYRQPSTDNYLSSLSVRQGGISFNPDYQTYRVVLPFVQDQAGIKATARHANAWGFRVNGTKLGNDVWTPTTVLKAGDSAVYSLEVLAEDTTYKRPYEVTIVRSMPDTNCHLDEIALATGKGGLNVTDGFSTVYDTMVVGTTGYNDSTLGIRAYWTNSLYRSVVVGADTLRSYEYRNFNMALPNDTNVFPIKVTAQDSSRTRTFWVKVFRGAPSRNADLADMYVNFNASGEQRAYPGYGDSIFTWGVPFRDSLFKVRAHVADGDVFQIRFNGTAIPNATLSDAIKLAKASSSTDTNRIEVVVVAQDTTRKKTYKLNVYRAPESKDASLSWLDFKSRLHYINWWGTPSDSVYRFVVPWHDSVMTVNATSTDEYARKIQFGAIAVSRGAWSDSIRIPLVNDTNRIPIVVTAQDSTVKRTYTVNVFRGAADRDAALSGLSLTSLAGGLGLTSGFSSDDTVYTASTLYLDSQVVVTPTLRNGVARRILVNEAEVASGAASGSIHLAVDTNVVTILVRAQDTTATRTYRVKVYRAPKSTDALLSAFGESEGTLSPRVNDNDTTYSLSVVNTVTSVILSPSLKNAYAKYALSVGGVSSGGTISLGSKGTTTTVTLVVTAQDPNVKRTYTLAIAREKDPNAIGGNISKDSTLTLEGSPYLVEANLVVKNGATLTIEPGVRLKFNPSVGMTIRGTLKAMGTESNKIVFTSAEADKWGMLLFDSTSTGATYDESGVYASGSVLKNCVLEYGGNTGITNGAMLYLNKIAPHLEGTTIQYSKTSGIYGTGLGDLFWKGNTIRNNSSRGAALTAGDVSWSGGEVSGNSGLGVSLVARDVIWNGGVVSGNSGNGMELTVHTFHIRQTTVSRNIRGIYVTPSTSSVALLDWLVVDTCQFLNNAVTGDGGGVYIAPGSDKDNLVATFRGNLFQGNAATNNAGGLYYAPSSYNDNQQLRIDGNTFLNNQATGGGAVNLLLVSDGSVAFSSINNVFQENKATNVGGVALSAADYWRGYGSSSYYDSANTYIRNQNGGNGWAGALWLSTSSYYSNLTQVRIVDSRFEGNTALAGGCGALEVASANSASILRNVFLNNSGLGEGAVRISAPGNLGNNLFQGNSTLGTVGALLWGGDVSGTISGNTFSGNSASKGGATVSTVMEVDGFPTITGNNFLTNTTDRVLRTYNTFDQAHLNANDNWWNSAAPQFYKILVDYNSDLGMSSLGEVDVDSWLSAPNSSAPGIIQ